MSGRRSRSKGVRTERGIVNALQASGIAAVRVPLSGSVGGRFAGDMMLPLMGRDLCVEVKARADGFPRAVWLARWARRSDRQGRPPGAARCHAAVAGCRNCQRPDRSRLAVSSRRRISDEEEPGPCVPRVVVTARLLSGSRPVVRRGLSQLKTTTYLGISASKFDELCRKANGIAPPKVLDGRLIFTVERLDEFLDSLPDENQADNSDWTASL